MAIPMQKESKTSPVKTQIYQAAAVLFREKGYAGTSVRELAQKVGLEASSLYNYIKSKEEILQDICMKHAIHFTEGIAAINRNCKSSKDKLSAIIQLHIDIATEDMSSVTVFTDEWKHLSEPTLSRFVDLRKDYEKKVLQIIQSGISTGELKKVDPQIALFTFLTALKWIHYWFKPGRINPERLSENMEKILLEGMLV